MLSKFIYAVTALLAVSSAAATPVTGDTAAADDAVLKAERIFHTLIDKVPFLVDRTSTIVWT
ncbi:hypothetical protein H0H81_002499, partial [Sphagnurus paluster]